MREKLRPSFLSILLPVLTALLLLAGCGRSGPLSYYRLAPLSEAGPAAAGKDAPAVGIGPVRLQEHLDRPQLVTAAGAHRLHLADRDRWAEPLAENIAWALRDNLAHLLGSEHFLLFPWDPAAPVAYQVSLEILHCEGDADATAHLAALWTIHDEQGKAVLGPRRSSYRISPAAPGAAGLAAALSEGLADLSRDIAGELARLPGSSAR